MDGLNEHRFGLDTRDKKRKKQSLRFAKIDWFSWLTAFVGAHGYTRIEREKGVNQSIRLICMVNVNRELERKEEKCFPAFC